MREAAGDDCYLLASGAPVLASLGVFDGIRVGPDVAEGWQEPGVTAGCRNAIESTVRRLWLSALVDPDPDVVFFRTTRLGLGSVAAELLRDLARVTGVRSVSDSPEWLLPEERAALAAFLLEKPAVRQLDPTIWSIDGRVVDFSAGFSYDEPMAVDLP